MPSIFQRMRARGHTPTVRPMFNVIEETEDNPAEITLYGDVLDDDPIDWWTGEPVPGPHITVEGVLSELDRVQDASEINIHLNSSGGDLFAGIAIHNRIKSFPGHKTVIVDGLAASAASVIMCAGDVVQVHPGSMIMIHNVASGLCGYYSTPELRELITAHEAAETSIKRIYAAKSGKSEDELQAMLDATTWMVGTDAIDEGFADMLTQDPQEDEVPDAQLSADGRYLMVAGIPHNMTNLGKLPTWLNGPQPSADDAQTKIPDVAVTTLGYMQDDGETVTTAEEGDMDITNTEELRSAYPELVAAIEHDAAQAERERIREINDIAGGIHNEELVRRAMFAEPMSAGDVALAAIQAEGQRAEEFLDALEVDAQNATDEPVRPVPAEDEDADDDQRDRETVNSMVNLYNSMKGRR